MEIQVMTMDDSYFKSLSAFRARGNYTEEFVKEMNKISEDVKLGSIRSCVALGSGEGWYELEFLKHCKANISRFIGVEPLHASAENLRTNLRSSLPRAESQVFETPMENWEGPGEPVDLITMFHVVYGLSDDKRQEFLKKVHDSWLVSGGYVAVMADIRPKVLDGSSLIFERLGAPLPKSEEIEADFLKAGFTKHYEHEMQVYKYLIDPEELLPFYQLDFEDRVITLDDLRNAMKGAASEGKVYEHHMMAIFKRKN